MQCANGTGTLKWLYHTRTAFKSFWLCLVWLYITAEENNKDKLRIRVLSCCADTIQSSSNMYFETIGVTSFSGCSLCSLLDLPTKTSKMSSNAYVMVSGYHCRTLPCAEIMAIRLLHCNRLVWLGRAIMRANFVFKLTFVLHFTLHHFPANSHHDNCLLSFCTTTNPYASFFCLLMRLWSHCFQQYK